MARTVVIPTADDSGVYFEQGAHQALLFSPGLRTAPTMHRRDSMGRWQLTTCGLQVFQDEPPYVLPTVVILRMDQAEAFARPCRRCWP